MEGTKDFVWLQYNHFPVSLHQRDIVCHCILRHSETSLSINKPLLETV